MVCVYCHVTASPKTLPFCFLDSPPPIPFPYFTLLYYINAFMSDLFILNCVRSRNIFPSAFDLSGPPLNVQQAGQTKTLTRVNLTGTQKDQQ